MTQLFPDVNAMASMPPRNPVEMPTQSLQRFDKRQAHRLLPRGINWNAWLAFLFVFGGGTALTIYGAMEMYGVVSVDGVTTLEWLLLILFVVNFSWISLALTTAFVGLVSIVMTPRRPQTDKLAGQTAVVMPIYNEDPARAFGAIAAMIENLAQGPHSVIAQKFDWFILSDTTDPDVWMAEERVFVDLRRRIGTTANIYYRHRPKNIGRKAGNIADFVTGWGGSYDYMLVLDADSLMTADAIAALAVAMDNDPDAGIVQTVPLIINRNTLFARLQQFAARIYGPVIATGLSVWSDRGGNYWGHNAIIRVRAFAECCGLPDLSGRPPFGGHILSHDFVEAALMRRAGWAVYMLPDTRGSYEESPPTLIDLAIRDRRWCQGNLQHIRVLPAKGLKISSRQHLATGIMSYLASPIWMAQLLVGIVLVLQSHYVRPEYFTNEFQLLPAFPKFDAARALKLFGVTMAVLLTPKMFGLGLATLEAETRRGCGGAVRLIISAFVEIVFSALMAPIMMVIQTGAVLQIAMNVDSGWRPQRRDDGSIPFRAIIRNYSFHMLLGLVTLIAGLLISPSLVAWMSPTIAGLLLAAVLAWGTGLVSVGLAFRRAGLLLTPEEQTTLPIVDRASSWRKSFAPVAAPGVDGLVVLHRDGALRELHARFLPPQVERRRGIIDEIRVTAAAKLDEAVGIEEAAAWLKPAERNAILLDRGLLQRLATLSSEPGAPKG